MRTEVVTLHCKMVEMEDIFFMELLLVPMDVEFGDNVVRKRGNSVQAPDQPN